MVAQESELETRCALEGTNVVFGAGATREVGAAMRRLGARRVLVVTDAQVARLQPVEVALDALRAAGVEAEVYDRARIEPTDSSWRDAIACASEGGYDGFVAVGGGSSIDTAKAANLYASWPAELLDYVNAPLGAARPVPGPLKPLVAIPTTAGTGSEATGIAVCDFEELRVKTGISQPALRPALALVDPDNTRSVPPSVAACAAFDILCNAIESLTAVPFDARPVSPTLGVRPIYQGANPFADVWAERALTLTARNIVRIVEGDDDPTARAELSFAAAAAGFGFGNAGVHLPHAMSYPVSGMVRNFRPAGYAVEHALVPHGMSVILNAPAVFRWTAAANPERHLLAARMLGVDTRGADLDDAGELLASAIEDLMRRTHMPNGLAAVGFSADDTDALAAGAFAQRRLTQLAPRSVSEKDLRELFLGAMRYW
jgi:hydroxyacid-oxoacid transhydrogenase